MKAANCPAEWGTYPGGHTPEAPFKKDLSLLTRFFEKHTFDPYPKEVTHAVVHPRYARAFWVDTYLVGSFLEKPPAPPEGRPAAAAPAPAGAGGAPPAMQKPYAPREAVFVVRVKDGNRIEIQANEHVAALDLYLTDKLVDMSKPVTVVMEGKTLYEGAPASPLKVKVRDGEELKATHLRPLWEDLVEIQKKAQYKPVPPQ